MSSPLGRPRGYITNSGLADLVRKIRRNHTKEELQSIFRNREDQDMFIRIGMAAKNDLNDVGRLSANKRTEYEWLGYEIATNSSQAAEFMTMQY